MRSRFRRSTGAEGMNNKKAGLGFSGGGRGKDIVNRRRESLHKHYVKANPCSSNHVRTKLKTCYTAGARSISDIGNVNRL